MTSAGPSLEFEAPVPNMKYDIKVEKPCVDPNLGPTHQTHSIVQRAEACVAVPPLRPVVETS